MRWFRENVLARLRRSGQDERTAEARACAEAAEHVVSESRRRQAVVRANVVVPLLAVADHNQFADMIRDSLTERYGRQQ